MKLGDRITKRVPIILAPNLNHQLIFAWAWCSSLWSNMSNRFQILTYPTLHCSSTRSISISPLSRCLFDHLLLRIEVRQFRLGAMDESWEMFRCSNWLCNWSRIEMKIYLDYLCISKSIIWLLLYYILYTQAMLHTNPGLMGRSHWLCSECWNSCRIPDSRHPCVPLVLPQWALHLPPRHSCMADPDRSSKSSTKINHLKSLRKGRVNIPNPNSPKTETLVSGNKKNIKGGTVYLNRIGCLGVAVGIASRFASQSSWLHATTALVVWCLDASSTMGQHDWESNQTWICPYISEKWPCYLRVYMKGSQAKFVGYVICAFLGIFNFEKESRIPPSIHQVDS